MESSEEEALFKSYPYTGLYFVQSPTTTVSFHSPTTQRRLTLSHYSSSRGSTNNSLHDKKTSYGPRESPDHEGGGGGVEVKGDDQKCGDYVGGESEEEEEEEERFGMRKKMWDIVSFSRSDSWVWILFQICLRLIVSFGVALLFFYLITKPPSPIISLKIENMNEFQLGEGVDNTGVTTKFLTCNCSINLLANIKSRLYGLHIHPVVLTMSFDNIPFATSMEKQALYASSNGPTSFFLYLGTTNKPMYGAGRSMQDILDSGKGLSFVIHVKLGSRFNVIGRLIRLKYHHRAKMLLFLINAFGLIKDTIVCEDPFLEIYSGGWHHFRLGLDVWVYVRLKMYLHTLFNLESTILEFARPYPSRFGIDGVDSDYGCAMDRLHISLPNFDLSDFSNKDTVTLLISADTVFSLDV